MRNILKLLHKNHFNYPAIHSIKCVRSDIVNGKFSILPPNQLFVDWENQGVLLLNTALTCKVSSSSSHTKHWKNFNQELIKFINKSNLQIKWFLWGKKAQAFQSLITNASNVYVSKHPSLNGTKSGSFYYENHFSNKVTSINWY